MIHIVQSDPIVPPGTCIEHLDRGGARHRMVRLFAGEPLPSFDVEALVILGGTMGAGDNERFPFLNPLMDYMAEAVHRDIPLIGICLGGQLLASALGGRVHSGSRGEKGVRMVKATPAGDADPLLAGLSPAFAAFQWHNDSFDLPPGAVHLASSEACPGQLFRFRRAYGLQFHPEVDEAIVARWVGHCGADPSHIAKFKEGKERLDATAAALFDNFLSLVRA
jgi:GMP synthase (glutamine-hydrolysing)